MTKSVLLVPASVLIVLIVIAVTELLLPAASVPVTTTRLLADRPADGKLPPAGVSVAVFTLQVLPGSTVVL